MCPMYSEAKQYQNMGVWNREKFIAGVCKEMVLMPLNSQISPHPHPQQELSAKSFSRKGEGVWLVVADFLVSEPLFLRPGYG